MENPRLATRYAKSLLDLAIEQKSLDVTLQDMSMLERTIASSYQLGVLLRSPVIKADKKQNVIDAILGDRMAPLTKAFVTLLVSKNRESVLPEISRAFITQYQVMHRIKVVKLTTATPVSEEVKQAIIKKLAVAMPDNTFEVTQEVDPELIGGFVLKMDDKLFDASVRRDLNDIKAQFTQNMYVSQLS
jgi:F-type H+-transporting ATPase subunit delta